MEKKHIFISYSRRDSAFAQRLQTELEQSGLAVWLDSDDLEPGTPDWQVAIREALGHAYAVIFLGSPEASLSPYVRAELEIARENKCNVYPVWCRGDTWASSSTLEYIASQYIDFRRDDQYEDSFRAILRLVTIPTGGEAEVRHGSLPVDAQPVTEETAHATPLFLNVIGVLVGIALIIAAVVANVRTAAPDTFGIGIAAFNGGCLQPQALRENLAMTDSMSVTYLQPIQNHQQAETLAAQQGLEIMIYGDCTPNTSQGVIKLSAFTSSGVPDLFEIPEVTATVLLTDLTRARMLTQTMIDYLIYDSAQFEDTALAFQSLRRELCDRQTEADNACAEGLSPEDLLTWEQLGLLQANSLLFSENYEQAVQIYDPLANREGEGDLIQQYAWNNRGVAKLNWAIHVRDHPDSVGSTPTFAEVREDAFNDLSDWQTQPDPVVRFAGLMNLAKTRYIAAENQYAAAEQACRDAQNIDPDNLETHLCFGAANATCFYGGDCLCDGRYENLAREALGEIDEKSAPAEFFFWRAFLNLGKAACDSSSDDLRTLSKADSSEYLRLMQNRNVRLAIDHFLISAAS